MAKKASKKAARKASKKSTKKAAAKPASRVARSKPVDAMVGLDEKLLGTSDAAVRKATGRGWEQWLGVLDRFGVRVKGHSAAATHLYDDHACDGWWAQMIVVGYERVRGIRKVREKSDGYSASVSRTIAATADRVLDAFENPALAARWLPTGVLVHKVTRPKSVRMTRIDGIKCLSVWLGQKKDKSGADKTAVQVQHDKIATERECDRMRTLWSERMDVLKRLVEA
jgi:hypothetical protein